MNKAGKKIIQEVIRRVSIAVTNSGLQRYRLAQELYWARYVIAWPMTEYKSWASFCRQHVNVGISTIDRYILIISKVKHHRYTDEQVKKMIAGCGWHNFTLGMLDMNKRLLVPSFIKKYHNFGVEEQNKEKSPRVKKYSFYLPPAQARKLDNHLFNYGMTQSQAGRRYGLEKAMQILVNRKL